MWCWIPLAGILSVATFLKCMTANKNKNSSALNNVLFNYGSLCILMHYIMQHFLVFTVGTSYSFYDFKLVWLLLGFLIPGLFVSWSSCRQTISLVQSLLTFKSAQLEIISWLKPLQVLLVSHLTSLSSVHTVLANSICVVHVIISTIPSFSF